MARDNRYIGSVTLPPDQIRSIDQRFALTLNVDCNSQLTVEIRELGSGYSNSREFGLKDVIRDRPEQLADSNVTYDCNCDRDDE